MKKRLTNRRRIRRQFCEDGITGTPQPSFRDLVLSIHRILCEHVEFTHPEDATLVACWIAGTYVYPLFTTFPRLHLTGTKGSGKSKVLQLISALSRNGLHIVAPTPAVLFRLIDPLRPTLCLDEMERLDRSEAKSIEAILNAGYKEGAHVPRVEGDVKREVVNYAVYAPVAVASIKPIYDVLADRAITVSMRRGLAHEALDLRARRAHALHDLAHRALARGGGRRARARSPRAAHAFGS